MSWHSCRFWSLALEVRNFLMMGYTILPQASGTKYHPSTRSEEQSLTPSTDRPQIYCQFRNLISKWPIPLTATSATNNRLFSPSPSHNRRMCNLPPHPSKRPLTASPKPAESPISIRPPSRRDHNSHHLPLDLQFPTHNPRLSNTHNEQPALKAQSTNFAFHPSTPPTTTTTLKQHPHHPQCRLPPNTAPAS